MPFTSAHPAAVLPLLRLRWHGISASALIAGSVAPDMEYLLRMKLTGGWGHTVTGAVFFSLPIAITMVMVFHLLKKPMIGALPHYFQRRLQPLIRFSFFSYFQQHPFACILCVITGITTHLIWDGFTHANTIFEKNIPFLSSVIHIPYMPSWPVFRYLQHLSTAAGTLYVVWVFRRQPMSEISGRIIYRFWLWFTLFFVGVFLIRMQWTFNRPEDMFVSVLGGILWAFIGAALTEQLLKLKNLKSP
jgi:hypothetical protein